LLPSVNHGDGALCRVKQAFYICDDICTVQAEASEASRIWSETNPCRNWGGIKGRVVTPI